jgi:hypothetical protein
MKHVLLIIIAFLFVFQSCKKDEPDPNPAPQESVLNYFPLTIGNYWVYETLQCDSGLINCEHVSIDTNVVSKDTLIDGELYYKIEGMRLYYNDPVYYRDSGDFIVDSNGEIIFTIKQSNEKYNVRYVINQYDTIFYWYYQLYDDMIDVNTSIADFECLDFRLSFFRAADNYEIEHNTNHMYSKDIGLIEESAVFVSSLSGRKRVLTGYHVQPMQITP